GGRRPRRGCSTRRPTPPPPRHRAPGAAAPPARSAGWPGRRRPRGGSSLLPHPDGEAGAGLARADLETAPGQRHAGLEAAQAGALGPLGDADAVVLDAHAVLLDAD